MTLLHRKRPCEECPWRRDTAAGQFPASRYEALRSTVRGPDDNPGLMDPMFACHKSAEGGEIACAGWLAVEGHDHVRVRLAAATGELDPAMLTPAQDWPDLFASYDEMADAQGR